MYEKLGFKAIDHQVGQSGHTATSIWMTKELRSCHFTDDNMKWKVLKSDNIIHRPHLDAYSEQVELPNGKVFDEFYHLHFDPVVCIVAETEEGQLIMERQYRHAVKAVLTEIPAGIVEKGEAPLEAAQRELLEETGYSSDEWIYLGATLESTSKLTNRMHLFLAKDCQRVSAQHLDENEHLDVIPVSLEAAVEMVMSGVITANSTAHLILKVARMMGV